MATPGNRREETPLERARRDPRGVEHDWLRATEEGTGQVTLEEAIDVATGGVPRPPTPPQAPEGDRHGRPIVDRFG